MTDETEAALLGWHFGKDAYERMRASDGKPFVTRCGLKVPGSFWYWSPGGDASRDPCPICNGLANKERVEVRGTTPKI